MSKVERRTRHTAEWSEGRREFFFHWFSLIQAAIYNCSSSFLVSEFNPFFLLLRICPFTRFFRFGNWNFSCSTIWSMCRSPFSPNSVVFARRKIVQIVQLLLFIFNLTFGSTWHTHSHSVRCHRVHDEISLRTRISLNEIWIKIRYRFQNNKAQCARYLFPSVGCGCLCAYLRQVPTEWFRWILYFYFILSFLFVARGNWFRCDNPLIDFVYWMQTISTTRIGWNDITHGATTKSAQAVHQFHIRSRFIFFSVSFSSLFRCYFAGVVRSLTSYSIPTPNTTIHRSKAQWPVGQ